MNRKLLSILVILSSLLTIVQPVRANSLLETTGIVGSGTPQSCSEAALRSVIASSSAIHFNCGPNPVTIFLNSEILLNGNKTIDGGGKITLDGQNKSRIFRTPTFNNFLLQNITLQNGKSVPAGSSDRTYGQGGAVFVDVYSSFKAQHVTFINNTSMANVNCFGGGAIKLFGYNTAEITDSAFTGNKATFGGAINTIVSDMYIYNSTFDSNEANYNHAVVPTGLYCVGGGGAILIDGASPPAQGGKQTIHISGSTFRNNKSGQDGGGIFSYLYYGAIMSIDHSTFESNTAILVPNSDGTYPTDQGMGGGLYLGGDESAEALFTGKYIISDSTINNNHADFMGGGINVSAATLLMSNTTIANNQANNSFTNPPLPNFKGMGGGVAMAESQVVPISTRFTNITVSGNVSGLTGGGIFGIPANGKTALMAKLENSLVANNLSNGQPNDCQRPLIDLGGNVQWPSPSGLDVRCTSGVLIGDPKLASLASNGGPSQTIAIQAGSAAIDYAKSATCPSLDQRSYTRSGNCDSGAFEYNGKPLTLRLYLPTAQR